MRLKTPRKLLVSIFDNHRLKSKMLMVYTFCVVIPVIVTNLLVLGLVANSEKKKTQRNLDSITESVRYGLGSTIEEAVLTAKTIYSKKDLTIFLDKEYDSPLEYYNDYTELNILPLLEYGYKTRISDIQIFTSNPYVLAGGSFYKIDGVRNTSWYKTYSYDNHAMQLIIYYDDEAESISKRVYKRKLTVVRQLGNYSQQDYEKLVKIDIGYYKMQDEIISANYHADVYIVCNGKIIFTNTESRDSDSKFRYFDRSEALSDKNYSRNMLSTYGNDFEIFAVQQPGDSVSPLTSYTWLIPILFLINLIIPMAIISALNRSICGRIVLLGEYFEKLKQENFEKIPERESKDEIAELIHSYNLMAEKMDMLIEVAYKSKIESQKLLVAKQQAELLSLYSQINPHFLFNALESIRMRSVLKKEDETAEIISRLAIIMRSSISWKNDIVTINDEAHLAESYLELQKYRFGDKLTYSIDIDESCGNLKIPKLTITTFVENACVHGIEDSNDGGMIFITAERNGDRVRIEIEDTGTGMDEKTAEKIRTVFDNPDDSRSEIKPNGSRQSIGIINASIRLKSFFNNDICFELDTEEGGGTLITISIPFNFKPQEFIP